jgi:hypothetical protein
MLFYYLFSTNECLLHFEPLKPKIHVSNIEKFSSYLTENTMRLHYKHQSVNATYENNSCLF